MQKSFSSFGFGLSLAVILLYLVMVAQFKSFLDPIIIMFAVPMGLIGVIWTLLATGTTLNIESFMGIIVMVGIVVSDFVSAGRFFANERDEQGQELRRATIESARIRMRPILDDRTHNGRRSDALSPEAPRRIGSVSFLLHEAAVRRSYGLDRAYALPGPLYIYELFYRQG